MIYISPLTQTRLSPTESFLKHIVHFSIVSHFSVWSHPQTGRSGAAGVRSGGRGQGAASGPRLETHALGFHPQPSPPIGLFAGALLCCPSMPTPLQTADSSAHPTTNEEREKNERKQNTTNSLLFFCCFSSILELPWLVFQCSP